MQKCFDTEKRIRLGIWGLGRGSNFIKAANAVNIDIVAGCDYNADLREKFRQACPDAFITADQKEFLSFKDMDAVLIATYFENHAEHTILALEAGFHVMCEVTSFFTPAEGVRVVEAVERSGKVYNLLENYPFTKENLYLAKLWKEGFFGEFQYGEFEYLHECRTLCYCYNAPGGGAPVEPGYAAHSWRSWLDFHYYNTHSLGPLMKITSLRPVEITAFPEAIPLPGYLPGSGMSKPCPSLIRMSNGGVMRNLCGATTGNYHTGKRIWGTRAAAESLGHGLELRIGAAGSGMITPIEPEWPELGELAETAGHGGGDFWELYYFARQILTGEPAPWTIYDACDVTLAGIMAVRSHEAGGQPMPIPDFRDPEVRESYRNDEGAMKRPFDPARIFPDGHDPAKTGIFNSLMLQLIRQSTLLRRACEGAAVYAQIADSENRLKVIQYLDQAHGQLPKLREARKQAQELIAAYPACPAAEALRSALTLAEPDIQDPALEEKLQRKISELLAQNK
ncbi:MAG: Gfo/Idh/MocA family oxidoreductase [Lentisphaeria bacterium]|nr:Gfo/Idh/MocA family oxidoreductase [Lentisphaeria bacterium]